MIPQRLIPLAAVLSLASVGTAVAAEAAPRFDESPFLGRTSGGAAVRYDLDRAAKATVTIDGRRAKVKRTDAETHEYSAFVNRDGFRQGRSYKVTIKVTGTDGRSRTFSKKLFMHRSLNAPR